MPYKALRHWSYVRLLQWRLWKSWMLPQTHSSLNDSGAESTLCIDMHKISTLICSYIAKFSYDFVHLLHFGQIAWLSIATYATYNCSLKFFVMLYSVQYWRSDSNCLTLSTGTEQSFKCNLKMCYKKGAKERKNIPPTPVFELQVTQWPYS